MSEQLQLRRNSATNLATFIGAIGEVAVDTTNNRLVLQDGATAGGFAAAKLAEVQTVSRAQANDANYTMQATDRAIAFIAITAARSVSLIAASAFQQGATLFVFDESGGCSATNTITLNRNGSDTIDGASSVAISAPYGFIALQSNGANKWTIVAGAGPSATTPNMDGSAAIGASLNYARADHTHPSDTSRAPLASPTFTGSVAIPGGAINATSVGATTASTGAFTTLSASGAVSGAGFSNYLASPPAIGGAAPAAGAFTTLSATATATFAAGTATVPPMLMQAGTNLTTAAAGAFEYDGVVFYSSVAASERGVIPSEQFITNGSGYTLTSQTAAQALFGIGSGQITLAVGTYFFECDFAINSMSATSGTFGFALGGTAVITPYWQSLATMGAPATPNASYQTWNLNSAANANLTPNSTAQAGEATIKGTLRVTTAGTIIPQVSLTTAAAAVIAARPRFKIYPVGSISVATVGHWS